MANRQSKSILSNIPKEDLGCGFGEVDLGTPPTPDSKALGITWDVKNDELRHCPKKSLMEMCTRHETLSAAAGQFDPQGMLAPCLLEGEQIFQKLTVMGIDWNDRILEAVSKEWCKWVEFTRDYFEFLSCVIVLFLSCVIIMKRMINCL